MSTRNKFRTRRAGRPLYFHVERLVRPGTGEEVGALVPAFPCDAKEMRSRKYSRGLTLRALITKPRNEKFHRLAHAIGQLAVDHLPGYEQLSAHEALKTLQRFAGIQCDQQEFEIPGVGKALFNVARSIAFDEMAEDEFSELVAGVLAYIRANHWPDLSEDAIEQFALMEAGQ